MSWGTSPPPPALVPAAADQFVEARGFGQKNKTTPHFSKRKTKMKNEQQIIAGGGISGRNCEKRVFLVLLF